MVETEAITRRFRLLAGVLDERAQRLVAAAEALSIGRGGSIPVLIGSLLSVVSPGNPYQSTTRGIANALTGPSNTRKGKPC